ncbi:hypothetical protein P261_01748 [Lachnospiraceae bacterium TWA4]|nr:hypothetical protein P261_01748 [Lachnospiraceae bacterium TWA4]
MQDTTIEVTAKIQKLDQKKFTVYSNQILPQNLLNNTTVEFIDVSTDFTVFGFKEDLEQLSVNNLNPTIDLKNVPVGEANVVEVLINLSDKLEMYQSPTIKVKVIRRN